MKKFTTIATLALATPFLAFASGQTISSLSDGIVGILNKVLIVLMAVALVFFVGNIIRYFIKGNEDHKEAAPYVMWSLIGFFVIISLWGLVNILKNTFFSGDTNQAPSWSSFGNLFPSGGGSGASGSQPNNNSGADATPFSDH